jgi:hypothetical protein
MSLENVQLVQRLAKAYNERDMDTLDSCKAGLHDALGPLKAPALTHDGRSVHQAGRRRRIALD